SQRPYIIINTAAASQIAIGLLAGPSTPAGEPVAKLLRAGRTLGIITTTPAWDFFPTLFEGMNHQHAPQSVWAVVDPDDECPVCGSHQQKPPTQDEGRQFAAALAALVEQEESLCLTSDGSGGWSNGEKAATRQPPGDNSPQLGYMDSVLSDCFRLVRFLIVLLLLRRMWAGGRDAAQD
ncbi:MAG: hypothetical protein ACREMY_08400, partial [bacterium]